MAVAGVRLLQTKKDPPSFRLIGGDAALTDGANRFLYSIEMRNLSWRTVRAYGFDLVFFIRWLVIAKITFPELTQTLLLQFIEHQRRSGASVSSINRRLSTVELFFTFTHGESLPGGGGVTLAKPYYRGQGYDRELGLHWRRRTGKLKLRLKKPERLVAPLTPEEVKAFLQGISSYRDLAMTLAMGLCGLRSCEVLYLKLDDVDLAISSMHVFGKGRKERIVPIAPQLAEALKNYLSFERPDFSPSKYLFVSLQGPTIGEGLTAKGFISLFARRRQRTNLTNANPHRFRHTFGANMARAGMQLVTLQKIMGHASWEMTLRYILLNTEDVTKEFHKTMARLEEMRKS